MKPAPPVMRIRFRIGFCRPLFARNDAIEVQRTYQRQGRVFYGDHFEDMWITADCLGNSFRRRFHVGRKCVLEWYRPARLSEKSYKGFRRAPIF